MTCCSLEVSTGPTPVMGHAFACDDRFGFLKKPIHDTLFLFSLARLTTHSPTLMILTVEEGSFAVAGTRSWVAKEEGENCDCIRESTTAKKYTREDDQESRLSVILASVTSTLAVAEQRARWMFGYRLSV